MDDEVVDVAERLKRRRIGLGFWKKGVREELGLGFLKGFKKVVVVVVRR